MKFNLYVVFIQRGSMRNVLFIRPPNVVTYWDFAPSVPETTTEGWYQKLLGMINERQLQNVSPRPNVCFAVFAGMTLLASLQYAIWFPFLVAATQLFSHILASHTLCSCLEIFQPLTTSAIPGAVNCKKLAPPNFAAGSTYSRKMELQFSQEFMRVHRITFHAVHQNPYRMESLLVLKKPS